MCIRDRPYLSAAVHQATGRTFKELLLEKRLTKAAELLRETCLLYTSAFRQECLHKAPKFGNDVDEVDAVAAEIIDFCCDALDRLEQRFGLRFHAQPFTFLWMLDHGRACAASPDGRRRGESIAYSVSPCLLYTSSTSSATSARTARKRG